MMETEMIRKELKEKLADAERILIAIGSEWKQGDEPYYPVNDDKNGALYAQYKQLADSEENVIFGGRLGEYKYYDMDRVIEVALEVVSKELK